MIRIAARGAQCARGIQNIQSIQSIQNIQRVIPAVIVSRGVRIHRVPADIPVHKHTYTSTSQPGLPREIHTVMATRNGFIQCRGVWIKEEHIVMFRVLDPRHVKIYLKSGSEVDVEFPTVRGCGVWVENVLGENDEQFRVKHEDELAKKFAERTHETNKSNKLENEYGDDDPRDRSCKGYGTL